jgi:hypothetical protein
MGEDEAIIARFVDADVAGIAVTYPEGVNPFLVSDQSALPADGRILDALEQNHLRQQSLVQRTDRVKPRVPPCMTRATKAMEARAQSAVICWPPEPTALARTQIAARPPRQRSKLMPEFIQQKRDIFRFQLFINTKRHKIDQLKLESMQQEKWLKDEEKRITDEIEQIKLLSVQLEVYLARARKIAEQASQNCAKKKRELNRIETRLSMMRSQISKNDDTLHQYEPYYELLMKLCPSDQTLPSFLQDVDNLIRELRTIESENLFLINHYQQLDLVFQHSIETLQADIAVEIDAEAGVLRDIELQTEVRPLSHDLARPVMHQQEHEEAYNHMIQLVTKTYIGCFGVAADLGVLMMLEKIEAALEDMYDKCDRVVPEFLFEKQTLRERQRRDQQQKEWHEWREKEQQRKVEQAIARARKPIPRRTARPLNGRTLPIEVRKQNDEAIKQRLYEQRQEEKLLYQWSDDEV